MYNQGIYRVNIFNKYNTYILQFVVVKIMSFERTKQQFRLNTDRPSLNMERVQTHNLNKKHYA